MCLVRWLLGLVMVRGRMVAREREGERERGRQIDRVIDRRDLGEHNRSRFSGMGKYRCASTLHELSL